MTDKKSLELPCVLYKPDGEYTKVTTQEEYDAMKEDGFTDEIPKDWNNTPDPANPGASLPLREVAPHGARTDAPKAPKAPAKKDDK